MAKQTSIQILTDLAHTRVDEATKRLGELVNSEHAAETKLKLLQEYREEYRARFLNAAKEGIAPDALRNYSNFIAKLDEAISSQEAQVDNSKNMTAEGKNQWVSERNRMKAFDTLCAREHTKEVRRELKQEQIQSDEHGAKHYRGEEHEPGEET